LPFPRFLVTVHFCFFDTSLSELLSLSSVVSFLEGLVLWSFVFEVCHVAGGLEEFESNCFLFRELFFPCGFFGSFFLVVCHFLFLEVSVLFVFVD